MRPTNAVAMSNDHVAIDGPVASGKTTVARLLAKRLGKLYLDTGAMYRALAFVALRDGIDVDNGQALGRALEATDLRIVPDPGEGPGYRVTVDGADVTDRLTGADVTSVVSTVAAHPGVRDAMVAKQRAVAEGGPVVMAGRDIGTVVLPDAAHKFFLTASLAQRAGRRHAELAAAGRSAALPDVTAQIAERDRLDESRPVAPLRPAADAIVLDSTDLSVDAVLDAMQARIGGPRAPA